jgi:hypothetical protein
MLQTSFSLMAGIWLALLSLLLIRSPNVATAKDDYQTATKGRGGIHHTYPLGWAVARGWPGGSRFFFSSVGSEQQTQFV